MKCDVCKENDEIKVTTIINTKTGQAYKIGHRCFNKYFTLDYMMFRNDTI